MNLYLIVQSDNRGYDTYDNVVVVAENETTTLGDENESTIY